MAEDARLRLSRRLGVRARYTDQTGKRRETGVETAIALLAAMGIDARTEAQARAHLLDRETDLPRDVICETDAPPMLDLPGAWQLTFEDGSLQEGKGPLPGLPLGIHRLVSDGKRYTLLSAPKALRLPPASWGVIAPLYGLSETGIGAYDDLGPLVDGLGSRGAAFLGLNPVHAGFPTAPELFSPYTPSHRRRLNVLHLPGGTGSAGPLVDYANDTPTRMAALRAEYEAFSTDPDFERFLTEESEALQRFALHQALSERHGPFWSAWPAALQDSTSAEARAARAELAREMRRHAWLQWRAEAALSAVQARAKASGMANGLYLDLAVGTHPHGAETWEDHEVFAHGASLGAPPDAFSADGQNWGLAPFSPTALRDRAYAPLAETLRRQLRVSGLLRIDHILGFERAFWVPEGAPGGYIAMPRDAMLAVVRIEAARADATVVGEDLGNIPKGLRGALEASGILGCRVVMFERARWTPPAFKSATRYDEAAMTSFSTHDLPTWDGWTSGADIAAREAVGDLSPERAVEEQAVRVTEHQALSRRLQSADPDGLHAFLAATPSRLVAVQAEIALGLTDQPNLPGTTTEYPNWRHRLPVTAKQLPETDGIARAARIMREAGR